MNYLSYKRLQRMKRFMSVNFCQIFHIITQMSTLIHKYVKSKEFALFLPQCQVNSETNCANKNSLQKFALACPIKLTVNDGLGRYLMSEQGVFLCFIDGSYNTRYRNHSCKSGVNYVIN